MANLSSKTGFSPVQTNITLTNNATTSVQDFAAYDSQELAGFVEVLASTNYRTSVKVVVIKNGAGTYEIAAADIAGDSYSSAPLVSFSMSGSILRATLPNVTGATSAKIQYQLNAPALGGTYPLTVNSTNINIANEAPLSYRNVVINGAFQVAQRGSLFTFAGSAGPNFSLDRWFHSQTGNGVDAEVIEQVLTTSPGVFSGTSALRCRQYKATGLVDGGTSRICHIIESSETIKLRGQTCTLSFYHRAPTAYSVFSGNWTVAVNYDTNGSTINSAAAATNGMETIGTSILNSVFRLASSGTSDTWTRSTFNLTVPDTARRIVIVFYSASNTTNNACLDLTQVQLEAGASATAFEYRPVALETQLCQRYCVVYGGSLYTRAGQGYANNATSASIFIATPTNMRTVTSATLSGNFALFNGVIVAVAATISGIYESSGNSVTLNVASSGLTAGNYYQFAANNSTSALLILSAEP